MIELIKKHWKVVLAILVVVSVSLIAIWQVPYCLVDYDKKGYEKIDPNEPVSVMINAYVKHHEMINAKRAAVIQVIGGVLFLFGMSIALRRAKAMEDNVTSNRETLTLDQYTRAIDQLGNNINTVRLGGIYSLEQIMNSKNEHDDRYHNQIIELLAAFVRSVSNLRNDNPRPSTVIQAIITVLGRRKIKDNEVPIDFSNSNLKKYDLQKAHLVGANLKDAHLEGANLNNAQLEGASLIDAHLENTDLGNANLEDANLWNANLNNAHLWHVNFKDTYMESANLENAWLGITIFENAVLDKVNFENAFVRKVILKNASLWSANFMGIKTSNPEYNKETNDWDIYNETDKTRTAFIKELEKAKDVEGIQLDPEIMDIIKEKYPDLYKRINKNGDK